MSVLPSTLHQLGRQKTLDFGPRILQHMPVLHDTISAHKNLKTQNKESSPGYKVKGPERFQMMWGITE